MKQQYIPKVLAAIFLFGSAFFSVEAARLMENLDRGVVAVRSGTSNYVGWRMFGTDPASIAFNVYRGMTKVNLSPITNSTNYLDTGGSLSSTYSVRAVIDEIEQEGSTPVSVWAQQYLEIPMQVPAGVTTPDGVTCTYSPNDCSVGDLDGDGQYEIVVKWDPSNSQDNSIDGYTGNVYLDAYRLDGARLWRIDLGINIRAGAHYTQFIVYDLDSDGRAEVACRTAPYSKDGLGNYILLPGDTLTDYRNSVGRILSGPEYLTIFDGFTGAAMATTKFYPDRVSVNQWGDNNGNRCDRFLAGVAYLDGVRPSLIIARGYYEPKSGYSARNEITSWNWRGGTLTRQWWFKAGLGINGNINSNYIGQGTHSLSIADVDGDGLDEIVYGACAIDNDGSPVYSTGWGHGDALHVSDMDPSRPGLEVWQCHESTIGSTLRDAATGAQLINHYNTADVGRACAANIYAGYAGYQVWSSATAGLYSVSNQQISTRTPSSINFVVWWDDDVVRELLDDNHIDKYGLSSDTRLLTAGNCSSNNGTKSTPGLTADILGDWREEVIWRASDNMALRLYTTTAATSYRMYTLMHDCQYREAIAWQNGAYNQPPHPSFYLGAGMSTPPAPDITLVEYYAEPGVKASDPSPAHQATDVYLENTLSWQSEPEVISHDVYFGNTNPPAFQRNQTGSSFDIGSLTPNTVYYWRIDDLYVDRRAKGDVWSFTTIDAVPTDYLLMDNFEDGNYTANPQWNILTDSWEVVQETGGNDYFRMKKTSSTDTDGQIYATGSPAITDGKFELTMRIKPENTALNSSNYQRAYIGEYSSVWTSSRYFQKSYFFQVTHKVNTGVDVTIQKWTTDGATRVTLAETSAYVFDGGWVDVKFTYDSSLASGNLKLYLGDMQNPYLTATDKEFTTFDSVVLFTKDADSYQWGIDDVEIYSSYEVLVSPEYADVDDSGRVDLFDFATIAKYWLWDCTNPHEVEKADINRSGEVDPDDLSMMADYWLSVF